MKKSTIVITLLLVLGTLISSAQNPIVFQNNNELFAQSSRGKAVLLGKDVKVANSALDIGFRRYYKEPLLGIENTSKPWLLFQGIKSHDDKIKIYTVRERLTNNNKVYWVQNNESIELFNQTNDVVPDGILAPIALLNNNTQIIFELENYVADKFHEAVYVYTIKSKTFTKLNVSAQYMSTPIVSANGKKLIYTTTDATVKDVVEGIGNNVVEFDIKTQTERIMYDGTTNNCVVVNGYLKTKKANRSKLLNINAVDVSSNLRSNNTPSVNVPSSTQFKLPFASGLDYCVSRAGTPAPTGPHTPFAFCNLYNFNQHGYYAHDFDTPDGVYDELLSSDDGTVLFAGILASNSLTTGYGRLIKVENSDQSITYYGHLESFAVIAGQAVCKGEVLGDQGTTGGSSGDHIHWELRDVGGASGSVGYGTFIETGGIPYADYSYKSQNNLNCAPSDTINPTTLLTTATTFETQAFAATFTDADEIGGSGLQKSYFNISDNNGTEWRANNTRGFFTDDFNTAINTDWTANTGTWSVVGGALNQADQTLSNTSLSAPLNQTLSNRHLYHFDAKMSGIGANRRAGFHFFSDNGALPNRGNSYFVWLRADDQKIQVYKVINDAFSAPELDVFYPFTANITYDIKIIHDRVSGRILVYINNALKADYLDDTPFPITQGQYISFRSGECNFTVDNFKAYRSRVSSGTINVTIGTGNAYDMRYQNTSPSSVAGRINSIVQDNVGNLSLIASVDKNIDWTAPDATTVVNDGTAADIATQTSTTQLQGNWSGVTDIHSSLSYYEYSIGTAAGATDVATWKNNFVFNSFTKAGLSLTVGTTYYVNVRATNNAGLTSTIASSNGVLIVALVPSALINMQATLFNAYPNPTTHITTIIIDANKSYDKLLLYDVKGKLVQQKNIAKTTTVTVDMTELAKGSYIAKLIGNASQNEITIIKE